MEQFTNKEKMEELDYCLKAEEVASKMASAKASIILAKNHNFEQSQRKYKGENYLAILAGSHYGWSPAESVRNINIIKGQATLSGNAMLGLIRKSGICEKINFEFIYETPGNHRTLKCVCSAKRSDTKEEMTREYHYKDIDAKNQLINKYPKRLVLGGVTGLIGRDLFTEIVAGAYHEDEFGPEDEEESVEEPVRKISEASTPREQMQTILDRGKAEIAGIRSSTDAQDATMNTLKDVREKLEKPNDSELGTSLED